MLGVQFFREYTLQEYQQEYLQLHQRKLNNRSDLCVCAYDIVWKFHSTGSNFCEWFHPSFELFAFKIPIPCNAESRLLHLYIKTRHLQHVKVNSFDIPGHKWTILPQAFMKPVIARARTNCIQSPVKQVVSFAPPWDIMRTSVVFFATYVSSCGVSQRTVMAAAFPYSTPVSSCKKNDFR